MESLSEAEPVVKTFLQH